jgi:ABC-2 type transport system permease protein
VTTTVGLVVVGEAVSGALAFGAGWFLIAVAFAGVGAVAAQMTSSASGARAIAGSTIGTFFVVRLAGDGAADNGFGWLSWLSPIGWSSKLEAFGTERWWVTVLLLAFAVAVLSVAVILASRRDVGGGVAEPRPGPAEASAGLRSVFGLARRLQTTSLLGWIAAIVGAAAVWGVLAETVNDMLEDNPQLAEIFEALGGIGRLTDVFFGALFGIVAIIVSAYAISVVLTLQHEEHTHRAEALLATPTPRLRWAASHLVYAIAGPVILLLVAAVVSGTVYGSTVGDVAGNAFVAMDSALVQMPAVWLTTALAVALYGFAPRHAGLAWGVLVIFLLLGQLGSILQLPQWALDLSPFTHVPAPPGPIRALPLVVMSVLAVAVGALGLAGLRRRDIA